MAPIAQFSPRSPPAWLLIVAAWVGVALFFVGQNAAGYLSRGDPIDLQRAVLWEFLYWLPWIALTPVLLRAARRYPLEGPAWRGNVLRHLVVALVFSAFQTVLYDALRLGVAALQRPGPEAMERLWSISRVGFVVLVLTAFYKYVLFMGVYYAVAYSRKYRERRVRAAELEAELSDARLQALTMQLQPHFLFNALHSASMLALENPAAAGDVLAKLSGLLRRTLKDGGGEVTLEEELDFIDRYLEIERLRFADRLRVRLDIAPEARRALVPSLILQPLVENAIRHGIGPVSRAGHLAVAAAVTDGRLELAVEDDGPGLPATPQADQGVGLRLTRERLARRYRGDGVLSFERPDGGGCRARVVIPYRTALEPAEAP